MSGFIGKAPGLSGRLAWELEPEDSLPACVSDRQILDMLRGRIEAEDLDELRSVASVLRGYRRAVPLALVEAEIARREARP